MITIYIGTKGLTQEEKDKIVTMNDAWFNLKYRNIKVDDTIRNLIESIDECKYVGNFSIEGKFSGTNIDMMYLSTGCKTAINCYCWPDRIFDLSECGENAIEEILKLSRGKGLFKYEVSIPYSDREITLVEGNKHKIITWRDLDDLMDTSNY